MDLSINQPVFCSALLPLNRPTLKYKYLKLKSVWKESNGLMGQNVIFTTIRSRGIKDTGLVDKFINIQA